MRTATVAFAVVAVASLAGCGSSGTKSNGEASKPPRRVLADALKAAEDARSVHVSGTIRSGGESMKVELTLAQQGGKGSLTANGQPFDFVRVGDKVYLRGRDAFWRVVGGVAAVRLFHGKWLVASATQGRFASLADLSDPARFFGRLSSRNKVVDDGAETYHGHRVVALRDPSDGSVLYVSATGAPYPVAATTGRANAGTITFDRWNEPVTFTAPKNAVPVSKLRGG